MLVQLLPDQISRYWQQFREAIKLGMQPITDEELKETLDSVLKGRLTAWVSGNESGINGFVLTCIGHDDIVNKKSFIIYFAHRFGEATKGDWFHGINTLKRAAQRLGCYRVVAYTESQEVVQLCQALGGRLKEFVIEFPIEEMKYEN